MQSAPLQRAAENSRLPPLPAQADCRLIAL
jgi:hypothetical protein